MVFKTNMTPVMWHYAEPLKSIKHMKSNLSNHIALELPLQGIPLWISYDVQRGCCWLIFTLWPVQISGKRGVGCPNRSVCIDDLCFLHYSLPDWKKVSSGHMVTKKTIVLLHPAQWMKTAAKPCVKTGLSTSRAFIPAVHHTHSNLH
jgi:hypothetical protein